MFRCLAVPVAFLLSMFAMAAHANESVIRKSLEQRFPGAKVQSVVKTPYAQLYEVFMEGQLFYTDANARYLIVGKVIDAESRVNLTERRSEDLLRVSFPSLPLENALKVVKGDGSRKIAVFSDPDCPFCKQYEEDLAKLDNVTIYTFVFPIEGLHAGATEKSKAIWCAPNRVEAWDQWMRKNVLPKNPGTCENPIAKNVQLGGKLGVNGTPTTIFADGKRIPGRIPTAQIEQRMNEAKAAK